MFKGAMVALVTPFRDGKVDETAIRELVEFQIASGTDVLVPCGTTGESATLTHEEHEGVVELVIEATQKRVPVIAGTGSNSTAEAIRLTTHAQKAGADGALLITPYYNKPTQEGLYQHYAAIAREVEIPLVLYNVPGRTGVNMLPETVARLSELPNVVAIKEAAGSIKQICEIIQLCGEKISVLSGEDYITFPLLSVGGKGVISVLSNICPQEVAEMIDAFEEGDNERARQLHYKLLPLFDMMFIETNPIPVKTALAMMGKCAEEFRLPLYPMSEVTKRKLEIMLKKYGLIK